MTIGFPGMEFFCTVLCPCVTVLTSFHILVVCSEPPHPWCLNWVNALLSVDKLNRCLKSVLTRCLCFADDTADGDLQLGSLFLASTVSALHRNAHIWNASHPLLVTYYCWVTVYSPGMEAKNQTLFVAVGHPTSISQISNWMRYRLYQPNSRTQCVIPYQLVNNNLFKLDITNFLWGPKNSVNAENIESFIYMLFKLYMQV